MHQGPLGARRRLEKRIHIPIPDAAARTQVEHDDGCDNTGAQGVWGGMWACV